MLNLYIIGCGGIGGYLIDRLPMVISSLSLDMLSAAGVSDDRYLRSAGREPVPSVVDRLTLVDGDVFDPRNALRQGAGVGGKLAVRMKGLANDMARVTFLQNMQIVGYDNYVNPGNVTVIIPKCPEPNADNARAEKLFKISGGCSGLSDLSSQLLTRTFEGPPDRPHCKSPAEDTLDLLRRYEASVVFLCVDNVKTRYEISKYMEEFDNCIVFNGGNSRTTGHVTIYERANGVALDPEIYKVYSNIRPDADLRPDEDGNCTTVAPKHDQIAVTNSLVADLMLARFIKWVRYGLYEKDGHRRMNEIVIDIEVPSVMALNHQLRG